jgi:hypothetical protein
MSDSSDPAADALVDKLNKSRASGMSDNDALANFVGDMGKIGRTATAQAQDDSAPSFAAVRAGSSTTGHAIPYDPDFFTPVDDTAREQAAKFGQNFSNVRSGSSTAPETPGVMDMNKLALKVTALGAKQKTLDDAVATVEGKAWNPDTTEALS